MIELTLHAAPLGGPQPLRGDLVRPEGDGPWPGVVMVHEGFGYDDVMRRQAERLAKAGFLTLAVDLFSAGGARRCMISTFRAMMNGSGRPFADIEAARQYLLESPDCTGKVGVIGFCMGGGFALLTASKGFDAASANYGMMPRDLAVFEGACPIVASYGDRDPLAKVAGRLEKELTARGVVHDVKLYPNAGHSFLNDAETGPKLLRPIMRITGMGPEPIAAADAWQRIDSFFHEHLATTGERPSGPAE
ncbi:dienelactone hydrolase family protein [Tenggerimyces flavus]|uniref:Dienelactone hydrolase family protein n=1 Tax=Tenggerimyces flavus TaxID=1708749 RepID=A0ABV7Y9I2_9ACTN|nr:dienelactone hydrolase family protein [Tenggerimyces flavus]MBM7785142.1 carboxymethylenebutenolidase [Tenggerimyces flavus]